MSRYLKVTVLIALGISSLGAESLDSGLLLDIPLTAREGNVSVTSTRSLNKEDSSNKEEKYHICNCGNHLKDNDKLQTEGAEISIDNLDLVDRAYRSEGEISIDNLDLVDRAYRSEGTR